MAAYRLASFGVVRESDGASIPPDQANADWRAYQSWLGEGNTPDPMPGPSSAQEFAAAIAAGCAIIFTETPALDGTYPIDPATQVDVQAVALYIVRNGRFPAGQSSLPVPDIEGVPHVFPSTDLYEAYATALGDYVTALKLGLPATQPVTIT